MPELDPNRLQQTLFAAAGGDQEAWRTLISAYSARVYALVKAQCGDGELAEEIAQSTFCTVAAKLADYAEVGRFESWLFRIAMNRLRDEMRRRRRHAVAVEDDALAGLAGAAPDEHKNRAEPAELALLRQALAHLPESDREVVHLRHYGELSFRQIAELLQQPLGTVLARQHRALQKLANLMEKLRSGDNPRHDEHSGSRKEMTQ